MGYKRSTIRSPSTLEEWEEVMDGFEEMQGIPNVCGAIDGSLIRIKRFEDHTGFYSRKGTTALNVQAVVNHRGQFISHSIRSGSQNDKACFNNSQFGNHCHQFMPEGGIILADAGYTLMAHIMTPYKIVMDQDRAESRYNYKHSTTRITVECAFGKWKNRFRVFCTELNWSTAMDMGRLICATMILHNWLIELGDDIPDDPEVDALIGIAQPPANQRNQVDGPAAKLIRDRLKDYLFSMGDE